MDYQIADAQRRGAPRALAFPEGVGSHTKIAVLDAVECNELKIAGVETPPGLKFGDVSDCPPGSKVAEMEVPPGLKVGDVRDCPPGSKIAEMKAALGVKVARPSMISLTGDFRLPMQLNATSDPEVRQKVYQKLHLMNPGPRRRAR
jgi:hypothetical protein